MGNGIETKENKAQKSRLNEKGKAKKKQVGKKGKKRKRFARTDIRNCQGGGANFQKIFFEGGIFFLEDLFIGYRVLFTKLASLIDFTAFPN